MKRTLGLLCMPLLVLVATAGGAGKGFTKLSLADALEKAGKEDKLVFVDWYTTWCGPCKKMNRTTFKDKEVTQWLQDHTVALKIDAEDKLELAKKYKIESYPTLMFLNADGTVAERVIGYRDSNNFLAFAKSVAKGETGLDRAKKLAKDGDGAKAQIALIRQLQASGKNDEALSKCKNLLAQIEQGDVALDEGMIYFLIRRLRTEEARSFAKSKADGFRKQIVAGNYDPKLIRTFDAAANASGETGQTLAIYDELKASGVAAAKLEPFHGPIFSELKAARRYQEIEAIQPVAERLAAERTKKAVLAEKPGMAEMAESMYQNALYTYYEISLGLEQHQRAAEIAREVLSTTGDSDDEQATAYNSLAWSAYEAGKVDQHIVEYAAKANKLSGGTSGAVLDTYARVLYQSGQRELALSTLKDALKRVTKQGRDRMFIQECLDELETQEKAASQG